MLCSYYAAELTLMLFGDPLFSWLCNVYHKPLIHTQQKLGVPQSLKPTCVYYKYVLSINSHVQFCACSVYIANRYPFQSTLFWENLWKIIGCLGFLKEKNFINGINFFLRRKFDLYNLHRVMQKFTAALLHMHMHACTLF